MMKLNQFVGPGKQSLSHWPAVLLEQLNLLLEQASPVLTAAKIDAEEVERGRLIREQQGAAQSVLTVQIKSTNKLCG